jgi:hypothetical protein
MDEELQEDLSASYAELDISASAEYTTRRKEMRIILIIR